ncbi:MAG: GAF domain-containing protein [Betaproteobacteria bacterium]|jgi:adenylate cyclase|nr:GAF domain-containing protein [Betaproteobacteria bacterium]
MSISVDAIRDCLEGALPATIATCARDGTPNVSYVSQVNYVDSAHVALTFQFFNKTRENVLVNPRAAVLVIHPQTAARYRLQLEYLRTETEGPLFESMKAKLAGIASHTGMTGVFRLRGADVYRVLDIAQIPGQQLPSPTPRRNLLASLRACTQVFTRGVDLETLLEDLLAALAEHLGVSHAMVLMLDGPGRRLFTVASRGYPQSGVGSEIALGCGVIGVAAEQRTPIRVSHMTAEYSYGRAIRESTERSALGARLETAIPLPGLADSRSQLAAPIVAGGTLLGVLYVESPQDLRFSYDDEDALVAVAAQLGSAIRALQEVDSAPEPAAVPAPQPAPAGGTPVVVRHYALDDSVFIGDDYLIKGVAGAILRKLLADYLRDGRTEFTNRELRLDRRIRLPDLADNLEARLVLLQRRLAERSRALRLEKSGRGRIRLCVERPVQLVETPR